MTQSECSGGRPPLKPTDIYRPRLGAQRTPRSRSAMSELQAWREVSRQAAPNHDVEIYIEAKAQARAGSFDKNNKPTAIWF